METPEVSGEMGIASRAPAAASGASPASTDVIILYLAALILRAAGFNTRDTAKVLEKLYNVPVSASEVIRWYMERKIWRRIPSLHNFVKVIRIARGLESKELRALRYLAGAALGDADQTGRLVVRDLSFAKAYAEALAIVTGDPSAAVVKQGRDGYYHTKCWKGVLYIRNGLWKVLAFLDELDERKYFLAGLLDAEGTLTPRLTRDKRLWRFQLTFYNTNRELVEWAMVALKSLGFKPKVYVRDQRERRITVNGKVGVCKKPVYEVYVLESLSKIDALARVELRCKRKKKLRDFLMKIKGLSGRERYEKFTQYWMKWRDKWWPIDMLSSLTAAENQVPQRRSQRRASAARRCNTHVSRMYVVECPKCGEAGTFELRKEVDGGKVCVRILVHHESGACEFIVAEGGGEGALVQCPACGEPGHIYVTTMYSAPRHPHRYVRVAVKHRHAWRKKTTCTLAFLRLANVNAKPPQPPPAH